MNDVVLTLIALCLSPVSVYLKRGIGNEFWINLILCLISANILGFLHAIYVIWIDKK